MGTVQLYKFELFFYFFGLITWYCYSFYVIYVAGQDIQIDEVFFESRLGYKRDGGDFEWNTWIVFLLYKYLPWVMVHCVFSEMACRVSPQVVPAIHTLITCSCLLIHFGPLLSVYAAAHVLLYYAVLCIKSPTIMRLSGLICFQASYLALRSLWMMEYNEDQAPKFMMLACSTSWLHLRCLSYCLDHVTSSHGPHTNTSPHGDKTTPDTHNTNPHRLKASPHEPSLYDMLGYTFYFPTYFLGPVILYCNVGPYMYCTPQKRTIRRVGLFLINMSRYVFWAIITEASFYFLYINALQYYVYELVSRHGSSALYALCTLYGQLVMLKYTVVFGLAGVVAGWEGLRPPAPPACLAHVHSYADLWRRFDTGLYQFVHKYVYSPLRGKQKSVKHQLIASAAGFGFSVIWHGFHWRVLAWVLFNMVGVTLEAFSKRLARTDTFIQWQAGLLSEASARRLKGVISAPLFLLAAVSNIYFFCGPKVGNLLVNQLFITGSWSALLVLLSAIYCQSQVSVEVDTWLQPTTAHNHGPQQ